MGCSVKVHNVIGCELFGLDCDHRTYILGMSPLPVLCGLLHRKLLTRKGNVGELIDLS